MTKRKGNLMRLLALLLATMLGAGLCGTALAALVKGERFTINVVAVYKNGTVINSTTLETTCKDTTSHSGYNHSINLKEFHPSAFGWPTSGWAGWCKPQYTVYTGESLFSTFYAWDTRSTEIHYNIQGSAPYKAVETIFLVYNNPPTYSYTVTHVYRTNGTEDGRVTSTVSNIASGATVSASDIPKKPTYNGNTYTFTSATPTKATITGNGTTFTLYYDRTVAADITRDSDKIVKVFQNLPEGKVPANFSLGYTISSEKGGAGTVYATGTITPAAKDAVTVSGSPAYSMSIPSFTLPAGTTQWYVTIQEKNAGVSGYTYKLDTSSKQITYSSLGNTLYYYNTYAPKTAASAAKEVLTALPSGVTIPDGVTVTYPIDGKAALGSGATSVTLLYKVTVSGEEGAAYTITDEGATCISGNASGAIPADGKAEAYFIKTFTGLKPGENTCTNTASVSGVDAPATVTTPVSVAQEAPKPSWEGLTVQKTADKATAKPGETITYTIQVTNGTGKALQAIRVSEKLNANLAFAGAQPEGQYSYDTGVWTIPALANGATATLTLKATVNSGVANGTAIPNTAVITGAKDEDANELPAGTNPSGGASVTVDTPSPASGLEIAKACDKAEAKAGESVRYTLTVQNTTGREITGITLKDILPGCLAGSVEMNSSSGLDGFTLANGTITWNSFSLAANASKSVTIAATIRQDAAPGTVVINKAQASAEGFSTVEASASLTVTKPDTPPSPSTDWAALTLEKTASKATAKPGDTVTYSVKVTNNTGKALTNLTVSEKLDANLTFAYASAPGSYDAKTGVWTIPSLANGASATLTLSAVIHKDAAEQTQIQNIAVIVDATADGGDKQPEDRKPGDQAVITVTGGGSTPSTPPANVPKTGDTSGVELWFALMLLALGGLAATALYSRKHKTR